MVIMLVQCGTANIRSLQVNDYDALAEIEETFVSGEVSMAREEIKGKHSETGGAQEIG